MQRHSKNNKKTIRIDGKTRQRICLFLCETKQMTEHQDERSVLMLRLILNNHINKSILFRQWPTKTWRNELRSNERGRSLACCDRFLRGEIGCCDSPLSSMTDAASTMLTASKAKAAAMAKLSARDMTLRLLSMVGGGGEQMRMRCAKRIGSERNADVASVGVWVSVKSGQTNPADGSYLRRRQSIKKKSANPR